MTNELITIVLTDYVSGEKTKLEVEKGSEDWKNALCILVPQQLSAKAERKAIHRHFDRTDLESFLTEQAYDILLSYDEKLNPYFEPHLRKCLAKKVFTFFNDKGVDKSTDYYSQKDSETDNGDSVIFEPDSQLTNYEKIDAEINFSRLLDTLTLVERKIITYTLKGFSGAEIADKINVARMTVHRQIKKLKNIEGLQEAILELIEARGVGSEALNELVSTEEEYYSEKRVQQRAKRYKKKVNSGIKSTTKKATFESVQAYNNLMKELKENNVDLYMTAVKWKQERGE